MPFDFALPLDPHTATFIAPETRLPGVAIFIGGLESLANIRARTDRSLKGYGHENNFDRLSHPRQMQRWETNGP